MSSGRAGPYVPPPYPYDRLNELKPLGDRFAGGLIDLSIGTPMDPPPQVALDAMATSDAERGYPPSIGLPAVRAAAADWLSRCFAVSVPSQHVAATIGTKEFVVSTPRYLHMRRPDRDTVLYPAISYPSYAMGAELAGLRSVPVEIDGHWRPILSSISASDAERALCLWVNSPGNPAGAIDDLAAAAAWGRDRDVPVLSDECYLEFTWGDPPAGRLRPGTSILSEGLDGVVALHSLSKRSNLAGARFGFYAGDPELVYFLSEVRKHAGNMVPGPIQHGAIAAFGDDDHVTAQRERYWQRLVLVAEVLRIHGLDVDLPAGAFYLWVAAPNGDSWALTRWFVEHAGLLVSPGEFYGSAGAGHVRLAVVEPIERLELIADRLAGSPALIG